MLMSHTHVNKTASKLLTKAVFFWEGGIYTDIPPPVATPLPAALEQ